MKTKTAAIPNQEILRPRFPFSILSPRASGERARERGSFARRPLRLEWKFASGFTLIELLVVIGVTATLTVLLVPSWAMSKSRGQNARCLSNLRQLSVAWIAYASDNRGKLVPNGAENNEPSSPTDPNAKPGGPLAQWCPGRQDEITGFLSPSTLPSTQPNIGYEWLELGLIYAYVNNVAVYKCPADISANNSFGAQYPHVRSISMNTWLSPISPVVGGQGIETYYKESDLVRPGPSQLFVLIDESPTGINDAFFVAEPGTAQWVDFPASYHNNSGGLSFADGHAEIKRWTDQAIFTASLSPKQSPPLDLTFLQNASSYVK
jgi:prepilin-type processing-associated H-X9-DG protein